MEREQHCPTCQRPLGPDARFCSQCGARLGEAGPARAVRPDLDTVFAHLRAGEQRPATILMTDVSGYTALGEQADPEWLYHLINDIFGELVECLVAHGAHIDKYMGDEIMALFGVPIAQERSVERAVRAALALRDRLDAMSREGRFGTTKLGLHTGINVGPVMVGPVGHRAHADYTVIGDAVNVTKRLEDEAPDGEIYVTRAVRDAVAELFEFESMGMLSLAGRRQEVEGFRLVAALSRPEATAVGMEVPLLGREEEAERLATAASRAARGRQTAVYVVGPAGIGKSRLLTEWVRSGDAGPFRVVQCTCHSFGQHFPLLPLAQIATQLLGLRIEDWPPRVTGDVSATMSGLSLPDDTREHLERLLHVFMGRAGNGNEQWREALSPCFGELLKVASAERPLCVVLEDIQWLDEASGIVLAELRQASGEWPLFMLVSSREPLDQPFPACLEAEMVPLPALPFGVIRQLVEAWAAPDLLPESTVEAICERAEGHPYFARELVHALRQGSASGVGAVGLPHTLQELFLAQLDWLPLASRRLVQAASVLGEPLSAELLEAAMGAGTELTPALLAEATRMGLLRPASAPEQFVFGRRLLFEAAYATIPTSRRRNVHARIASHIIEQQDSLGAGAVHAAAHHAYLGFGDERAIDLLLESARRYRLEYSNHQAIRDATRATELMSALPNPEAFAEQRLEALWLLAQSYEVLGDLDRAEGVLAEAEILLDESHNQEMVAQIALSSGTLYLMRGELDEAARHYARAREEWQALGEPTRVAHSLLGIGMCASAAGDQAQALQVFQEAAELANVEPWLRAAALNNAGVTLVGEGRYSKAEPYLREGLEANELEGDRRGVAHSKASLGELCYRLTRTAEAAQWLDEALAEAEQVEDPAGTAVATLLKARLLLHEGQACRADEILDNAAIPAGMNADIDALLALVRTETSLALGQGGAMQDAAAPEACGTSAVCRNARTELLAIQVEAALARRDPESFACARAGLAEHAPNTPDRHLRRYAQWLASIDAVHPTEAAPLAPCETGERTVLDVRARRLRDVL